MRPILPITILACAAAWAPLAAGAATPTETDVLVIGGGASGTAAAIQAARLGAWTLVLEETPWLGGMLTAAGVSATDGNNRLPAGIWGEFRERLRAHYGGAKEVETGWVSNTLFEPSVGAAIFSEMLAREKNARVWFDASFISIKRDGDAWLVRTRRGGKKELIRARALIDATELGDAAKACGAGYDIGMEARSATGEAIAPEKANGIVQDLTYVAVLKDYGPGADMTVQAPDGYDPSLFYCSCVSVKCVHPKEGKRLSPCDKMLTYGKLPNGKYMINWPIEGNDYYADVIGLSPERRAGALLAAKQRTLSFVRYIQTELGYKNLGLADDEFPTADRLPFIPYHRESRRVRGLVRFDINQIAKPYDQPLKLYRTGIAVGDYPVDHHHARYPRWDELPDLHFYPVPSYSLPLGTLLPAGVPGLIVAEKSISVSNLANGTTRLQPVVLQIGQAAGVLAALAVKNGVRPDQVPVRSVQAELLAAGGYIMPYLDVPSGDPLFLPLQRVGAAGIMKGIGRNVAWSNETWFRAGDTLRGAELDGLREAYPAAAFDLDQTTVTVRGLLDIIKTAAASAGMELPDDLEATAAAALAEAGIRNADPDRPALRGEAALLIDRLLSPFDRLPVDIKGAFIR